MIALSRICRNATAAPRRAGIERDNVGRRCRRQRQVTPEIVELAIAEMEGLTLTGRSKHWRFRPKNGISPIASRIHGIWDEDVADAPEFEDVVDDVLLWLEDKPIVGHNVKVEVDILSQALEGWEPAAAYDTLKIARRLLPPRRSMVWSISDPSWA